MGCLAMVCASLALFLWGCTNCLNGKKSMAECREAGSCNWMTKYENDEGPKTCASSDVTLDRQGFPPEGHCDEKENTGGSCYDNGNCKERLQEQKDSETPCCVGQC